MTRANETRIITGGLEIDVFTANMLRSVVDAITSFRRTHQNTQTATDENQAESATKAPPADLSSPTAMASVWLWGADQRFC